jgi:hypothetical protein
VCGNLTCAASYHRLSQALSRHWRQFGSIFRHRLSPIEWTYNRCRYDLGGRSRRNLPWSPSLPRSHPECLNVYFSHVRTHACTHARVTGEWKGSRVASAIAIASGCNRFLARNLDEYLNLSIAALAGCFHPKPRNT